MNEVPTAVRGSAEAVKGQTAPDFDVDKEYIFSIRSFRYRNNWAFCTVTHNGENLEILIGQAADYPLPAMLQAKQFSGNVTEPSRVTMNTMEWSIPGSGMSALADVPALRGFIFL